MTYLALVHFRERTQRDTFTDHTCNANDFEIVGEDDSDNNMIFVRVASVAFLRECLVTFDYAMIHFVAIEDDDDADDMIGRM